MTLAYSLLFFVGLPLITQTLHIFTFSIIAVAYVGYILVLLYIHRKKLNGKGVEELIQKTWLIIQKHWMVVAALIIIAVQLSSIHLFYTGTVTSAVSMNEVTNSYYPYPYFSDEWVTAGLVKYTIQNHSLATINPFDHNRYFPNILIVFPSVISQFFLITGANPVTSYWILGLLISLLNIFLVYVILCKYNVNRYISAIGLFGLSSITNSGNLPAFWTLLPISLSLTFLFLAILSEKKRRKTPDVYIFSHCP